MRKKKKSRRLPALFLILAMVLGVFPGSAPVSRAAGEVEQLIGATYFAGDSEILPYALTPNGEYEMKVYSDFPMQDTYIPWILRMQGYSGHYQIPYGGLRHWPAWNLNGTGWSDSIGNIVRYHDANLQTAVGLKEKKIKLEWMQPEGNQNLSLAGVQGCYDPAVHKEGLLSYHGKKIQFGFNEAGVLDVPVTTAATGGAISKLQYIIDQEEELNRAFVTVEDSGQTSSYQMNMTGNWGPSANSPSPFPPEEEMETVAPGLYLMTAGKALQDQWAGKTASTFQWSDLSVYVQTGYLISGFDLPAVGQMSMTKGGSTPKQLMEALPKSTVVTFSEGLPESGETWQKEMNIKWKLNEEHYRDYPGGTAAAADQWLRAGDTVYFVMEELGDGYFRDENARWYPEIVVTIAYPVDEGPINYPTDFTYESGYRYITKYHQDYLYYSANPGQTFEDIGFPDTMLVDYYTSDGVIRTERVKMDWSFLEEDRYPPDSDLYPYTYFEEGAQTGRPGFNGAWDSIGLTGQVENTDGLWKHASSVRPIWAYITLAKRWIELDVSEFTQDTYLLVQDGKLKYHRSSEGESVYVMPESPFDGGPPAGYEFQYTDEYEYDMSEYSGIRLYSSKEDYPLKTGGLKETLLTVRGEHVNLWLDGVELRMTSGWRQSSPKPLITLESEQIAWKIEEGSDRYKPHYASDIKGKAEVLNLWYPDMGEWMVDTSLIIHCSGKNTLESSKSAGPAIRVPYNTMLAISEDPGHGESELTAIGGNEAPAIGDTSSSGFMFVNNVALNLGRNGMSVVTEELPLMGTMPNERMFSISSVLPSYLFHIGELEEMPPNFRQEVVSRPIEISGSRAVVAPVYPDGEFHGNLGTIGAINLRSDSRLVLKDGATLKTSADFLPPAYSILTAWHKRGERPYQDATIIFNYKGGDAEYAVTFDKDGKVLLTGMMHIKRTTGNFTDAELEATTEFKGMYPNTRLDFLTADLSEEVFGPTTVQVENGESMEVNYLYIMRDYLNLDLEPSFYYSTEEADNVRLVQEVDNDLFRTVEPIIGTYNYTEPKAVVGYTRFPTKQEIETVTGQHASTDAEKLMEEYQVTEGDLIQVGIDPNQEPITLSQEQKDRLTEIGALNEALDENKTVKLVSTDWVEWSRFMAENQVTAEDMLELGVDVYHDPFQTAEELEAELANRSMEQMEEYERKILNNSMYLSLAGGVQAQHWQFVDKFSPSSVEELNESYFPDSLYAEVSRMVDGELVVGYELVPVRWEEEFLSETAKTIMEGAGLTHPDLYTYGYATGNSYGGPVYKGWRTPGKYRFTPVLPDGYLYETNALPPIIEVSVIEGVERRKWRLLTEELAKNQSPTGNRFVKIDQDQEIVINLVLDKDDRKAEIEQVVRTEKGRAQAQYTQLVLTFIEKPTTIIKKGNVLVQLWDNLVANTYYEFKNQFNYLELPEYGKLGWNLYNMFPPDEFLFIDSSAYFAIEWDRGQMTDG